MKSRLRSRSHHAAACCFMVWQAHELVTNHFIGNTERALNFI
jgi:hypothetical protein